MTAPVPCHRRWKALGVGMIAIMLLGFTTLPEPPPAPKSGALQSYHLLTAGIEYRDAQSVTELPSVSVIRPARPGHPERRWLETYEAYEDMAIVDRQIITREEICYTTRESDGSLRMRTRSTVPEIDSLMQVTGDASAVSRFLSEENGGKEVNYMASTVLDQAVCFLLRGETRPDDAADPVRFPLSDDANPPSPEDFEGGGSGDTIDVLGSHSVRARCLEGCPTWEIRRFFAARVGPVACNLLIGLRIDPSGRVDQVYIVESGEVPACDATADEWARSTRWSLSGESDPSLPVWIFQEIKYSPLED